MAQATARIGLIVRSAPFAGRSGRDQLDLALAAATLGAAIELFFTEAGALQLLGDRTPSAAGLPGGIRGWASLPELAEVKAWVSEEAYQALTDSNTTWALDVAPAKAGHMARRLAGCDCVMVV